MLSLRCYVTLVFLTTLSSAEIKNKGWWKNTVFYQIYPRSFKDSNDDGVGDLQGIARQLQYVKDLGVGALWLSPIFASPMVDFGYDISNFRKIHEEYGTLPDFQYLTKKAKQIGLKVVLDLVPNHSSDQHEWFQKALQGDEKYLRYYTFYPVNSKDPNTPPNNWLSVFGGSAWTKTTIAKKQLWYFHQFLDKQPDLNYANQDVRNDMADVIRFWLEKGVDGFRVDAINYLTEDERFLDEPPSNISGVSENDYKYLNHIYTQDQPGCYEIMQEWRNVLDDWSNSRNEDEKVIMTEAYTTLENTLKFYNFGSHVPFNFQFIIDLNSNSTPAQFKTAIDTWMSGMRKVGKNYVANWVAGNHDNPRIATRYPGRNDQMVMLGMILPGVTVTYYGEELGMENLQNISFSDTQDPQGCAAGKDKYQSVSRDPERSPFQWDDSSETNAGFNEGAKPWLPIHPNYQTLNVKNEMATSSSHYNVYKALIALKKSSKAVISGNLRTVVLNKNKVLGIVRAVASEDKESVVLLINFSDDKEQTVNITSLLDKSLKLAVVNVTSVSSGVRSGTLVTLDVVKLPPKASFVLLSSTNLMDDGTSRGHAQSTSLVALALSSLIAFVLNSM